MNLGFKNKGPIAQDQWKPLRENKLDFAGLLSSLEVEHDYLAEVEGRLPAFRGTLYRNGPGLYHRGSMRKRMALDGDGMIQAFTFDGEGQVRFQNRFVRTEKFQAEEKAGKFLFPTWSTLAPGMPWRNFRKAIPNQAGITVIKWADELYAFDEGQPPYRLQPDSLETEGVKILDEVFPSRGYLAHWKLDSRRNEWLNCSIKYGKNTLAAVTACAADGKPTHRREIKLPRTVYMHDWFATENYFIFVLHPAFLSISGLLRFQLGLEVAAEMIRWQPEKGTLVCVAPRAAEAPSKIFEIDASWVWHAFNAFEKEGVVFLDFVGSAGKDVGVSAPLFEVMRGIDPQIELGPSSFVRRYLIDIKQNKIGQEIVAADANYEMPFVSQSQRGCDYRFGFVGKADPGKMFLSSIARIDFTSGKHDTFHFDGAYCSEPVFIAKSGAGDEGWVTTVLYRSAEQKSSLAILDAQHLADGPVALVKLTHHLPISFHGWWASGLSEARPKK